MEESVQVGFALICYALVKGYFLYATATKKSKPKYKGRVSELWIYPIKSCKGIKFDKVDCTNLGAVNGFASDRHWLIISSDTGVFVSQRVEPTLALVSPSFHNGILHLDAPGKTTLVLPSAREIRENVVKTCRVWGNPLDGQECGDEAADWISTYLNKPGKYRLVCTAPGLKLRHMSKDVNAKAHNAARPGDQVVYSDFSQYMMMNRASLDDLNTRLEKPVKVQNFRPNIVIDGPSAFSEDDWKSVTCGDDDVKFSVVRHCTRCIFTTIDPEKGVKDPNEEPLKTLRSYRLLNDEFPGYGNSPGMGIMLAMNDIGQLKVGDPVYAR